MEGNEKPRSAMARSSDPFERLRAPHGADSNRAVLVWQERAMTLVAAMRIDGVPTLIGDFLLTDRRRAPHSHISTRPALIGQTPAHGEPRIAGLRKKIHRISPSFVVGFTGAEPGGRQLLSKLAERFGQMRPSPRDVGAFLAQTSFPYRSQSALVGWIAHKRRPVAFSWHGAVSHRFNLRPIVCGSGAAHFQNEIMPFHDAGRSESLATARERASFTATTKMGRLLLEEIASGGNLKSAYGFGAECLVWDGQQFRYIEKITYSFWNVVIQEDNSLRLHLADVMIVYRNFDRFSLMQVTQLEFGPNGPKAKNPHLHMITSLHDSARDVVLDKALVQSMDSPLCFAGVVIANPKKRMSATFCMVSDNSGDAARVTDGHVSINARKLAESIPKHFYN